ncbi:N-acetylmuramoyl-L-alanine amidase [Pseudoxanthomonas winnipegensis]|jgi:N-acetylmuramoyl-L-alanine amidase|uniref:N-acetylmuramoyl-L-alanine amidase AmiC n=1 Tax=Pseudoxanthomonas winnipegensis TaxID=2480810 RepID=A0A4Q8L547_9GAMM|nr:AMIN domain-containing protein [Pseudoxanthomonas winnipegensis]
MPKGMTALAIAWGSAALLASVVPSALAGEVRAIDLINGPTGTRAEIQLQGAGAYKTISLANPNRLVVDLPASTALKSLKLPAPSGVVTAVRTGQPVPGTFRVVFDLAGPITAVNPHMEGAGALSRLVIEWPGDGPSTAASAPAPTPGAASAAVPASVAAAQATSALVAQATRPMPATPAPVVQAPVAAPAPSTPSPQQQAPATPVSSTLSPAAILAGQPVPGVVVPTPAATNVPETVAPGVTIATGRPAPVEPKSVVADAPAPVLPQPKLAMRAGMRPLVIAIDAGHGGQDSGAIGPTGKYEKNVTLAIARQLARQIDATPGLKSYLTRDGDYFIPLNQRAVKARAAHADMFISIHADAAENRSASGSSVYVLSLKGATSQRARWLADKENASDLIGGVKLQTVDSTLGSVLIDLAQSGHMKASENAAGHVLAGLKDVGNAHKATLEKANFAVLRTSDMPAMLVETAFISNYTEEKQLTDPAFQAQIAGAILQGVETYFSREPPPGTLFAARAQAAAGGSSGGGAP